ncbi:MAG: hypothetical protein AUJ12_08205 [Alphaproteobacteria bacterium CG1_02_46_17]|nr:MAG: hypothetical protein AUJ12_08205 [Alphaproteobacteria bacterium CG1_02_46_17]
MIEQHDITEIQERNRRVELDKAWETSATRRVMIAGMTYIVASLYMWSLGVSQPILNALIPTGGYLFSTLSLPMVKKIWIEKIQNEKEKE